MSRSVRRIRSVAGFTLIEILLALVVLSVGLIGLLSLFPVGIHSSKTSTQDTMSALVAESVYHALVQAIHSAGSGPVVLRHDGLPNGEYTIDLPAGVGDLRVYPKNGPPGTDPSGEVFRLGTPAPGSKIAAAIEDITSQTGKPVKDPSDAYGQYSFDLEITRLYAGGFFLVRIRVYRNYRTMSYNPNTETHPDLIREFRAHVTALK